MYAYKPIIIYILELSPILTNLFMSALFCLRSACLIIKPKVRLELCSFAK